MSSSPTEREAGSPASPPAQAGETGAVEIAMPQMGVSVAEGTIVEWLKQPGDWVEADETVAVVSTDKVDVEIPSPASGRLERILVAVDETVPVGTPLAEIDPSGRPGEAHPQEDHEPATPQAPAESGGDESSRGRRQWGADRSRFHSPVVRRIAEQHGIDLSRVQGTGRRRTGAKAGPARPDRARGERAEERPLHIESPYRPPEEAAPDGGGSACRGGRCRRRRRGDG